MLGGGDGDREEVVSLLKSCLSLFEIQWSMNLSVKRGLSYYTEDGFEVEVESLGAQKQIAGGGRYADGIGTETPLLGFSATKSVISALIGILVRDGLVMIADTRTNAGLQGEPQSGTSVSRRVLRGSRGFPRGG